jgi:hypothetical protein
MAVFPQLTSGALAQFPVRKSNQLRTVVNTMADGSVVKLADPAGAITEWQLQYSNLSDAEAAAMQQFFLSMEGSLNVFTFLDPTANLLAWSDQLTNDVWTADPFAGLTGGVADPLGGTNGWTLSNSGAAPQGVYQTLNVPGGYTYCLSVYVQSATPGTAILMLAGNQTTVTVGSGWTRFAVTGQGGFGKLNNFRGASSPGHVGEYLRNAGGDPAGGIQLQIQHYRWRLCYRLFSRRLACVYEHGRKS